MTKNAADRIRSVDGVTTVIESIDLDKREHYMCVILRNGVTLVQATQITQNFSYRLSTGLDRLENDIVQAMQYDEALRQKRSGELDIERIERANTRVIAAVKAVQNNS